MSTLVSWEILSFLFAVYCLPPNAHLKTFFKGTFLEHSEQWTTECVLFLNAYTSLQWEQMFTYISRNLLSQQAMQSLFIQIVFYSSWLTRYMSNENRGPQQRQHAPSLAARTPCHVRCPSSPIMVGWRMQLFLSLREQVPLNLVPPLAFPRSALRHWLDYAVYQSQALGLDSQGASHPPSCH